MGGCGGQWTPLADLGEACHLLGTRRSLHRKCHLRESGHGRVVTAALAFAGEVAGP